MTASRAVKELSALGVVDQYRPGRALVVQWRSAAAAAQRLAAFDADDLRRRGAEAFAQAYQPATGRTLLSWNMPDDDPSDPLVPARVAVIVTRTEQEDDALDDVGPALDLVHAAGWPRPDVTVFVRSDLEPGDDVARAVLAGRPI